MYVYTEKGLRWTPSNTEQDGREIMPYSSFSFSFSWLIQQQFSV